MRATCAQGFSCDDAAPALRAALLAELRAAGLDDYEGDYRGTVWWSSLLHLAAPLPSQAAREALVAYVEMHRQTPLGTFRAARLDLVRYRHHPDGRTLPDTLVTSELSLRGTHT